MQMHAQPRYRERSLSRLQHSASPATWTTRFRSDVSRMRCSAQRKRSGAPLIRSSLISYLARRITALRRARDTSSEFALPRQYSAHAVDHELHGERGQQHAEQARQHDIGGGAEQRRDARREREHQEAQRQYGGDRAEQNGQP